MLQDLGQEGVCKKSEYSLYNCGTGKDRQGRGRREKQEPLRRRREGSVAAALEPLGEPLAPADVNALVHGGGISAHLKQGKLFDEACVWPDLLAD